MEEKWSHCANGGITYKGISYPMQQFAGTDNFLYKVDYNDEIIEFEADGSIPAFVAFAQIMRQREPPPLNLLQAGRS